MTQEEFEALMDKYLAGQATASEERMMDDFFAAQERKQSLEHYGLSEAMWSSIENRLQHKTKPANKKPLRRVLLPVSLALVATMVWGVLYYAGMFSEPASAHWVTSDSPRGQKSVITLADGSRVFLNAGSSLSYPEVFDADIREVKLTGEAFFEITKNPKRPFVVTSGNVTTKVLGTSFNIQAFPQQQISVTVATGRVQVEATSPQQQEDGKGANRVILTPNDQAVYASEQEGLVISHVNIDKFLAWKDNTLLFENSTIEEAVAVMERWYNVSIAFDDVRIKSCRINGQYKDESLENVLKSIQYMYHVDFMFTAQNTVTLYGKGCNP
ncbi:FecR family protein [Chryseolinea lacunae]|uniref:FecR domain-containing protein n=1 Tax=Chryseolinea lacunae TaxID=2801331 RepID=A0ABS1KLS3_9BACT|nr:FecR domain-containing protein [Chryseolinea lacunae]MBL0740177.1 FecR domain-containing protein [Chryseolinea lacunae]